MACIDGTEASTGTPAAAASWSTPRGRSSNEAPIAVTVNAPASPINNPTPAMMSGLGTGAAFGAEACWTTDATFGGVVGSDRAALWSATNPSSAFARTFRLIRRPGSAVWRASSAIEMARRSITSISARSDRRRSDSRASAADAADVDVGVGERLCSLSRNDGIWMGVREDQDLCSCRFGRVHPQLVTSSPCVAERSRRRITRSTTCGDCANSSSVAMLGTEAADGPRTGGVRLHQHLGFGAVRRVPLDGSDEGHPGDGQRHAHDERDSATRRGGEPHLPIVSMPRIGILEAYRGLWRYRSDRIDR